MNETDLTQSNVQLNNSTSKMKYSFSKQERFNHKQYNSPSPDRFYDLPDIKSKRGAGIGIGNKTQLGKQTVKTPSPNTYQLRSSFQLKKNEGFTMYEGREKIKANNLFNINNKLPSPSEYNPEIMKKSLSFSLGTRLPDNSDKWVRSIPGPGTYAKFQTMNKQARVPVSKYLSAASTRFSKDKRLSEAQLKNNKVPGPSEYNNDTLVSKKFYFKNGYKFPHSSRSNVANMNRVPGPGAYNRASDFG